MSLWYYLRGQDRHGQSTVTTLYGHITKRSTVCTATRSAVRVHPRTKPFHKRCRQGSMDANPAEPLPFCTSKDTLTTAAAISSVNSKQVISARIRLVKT